MQNPRKVVVLALEKLDKYDGYSNLVLDAALKNSELSKKDVSLVSSIFYGVLERQITLDYILSKVSSIPLKKLDSYVLNCLRSAVYQIKYLDKIPTSAAVNEAVKLVKQSKNKSAFGYVNAVLRKISNTDIDIPKDNISVRLSAPLWFIESLTKDYGKDTAEAFLEASLEIPPTYIRTNTLKITTEELVLKLQELGINAEKCDLDGAVKVEKIGSVENNPLYKQGLFHVEDLASQYTVSVLAPKPLQRVLDICAAPGGKSFTAAEYMENSGELMACDLYPVRVGIIADESKNLGIKCISAMTSDATMFNPNLGSFDRVLCDVPCSGFGIIRRKPDIKYKTKDEISGLPKLQYDILKNSANYVKSGGILVYSTCTVIKAENEDNVTRFLAENKDFEPLEFSLVGEKCSHITLMPQLHGTDGFFIAAFIRK